MFSIDELETDYEANPECLNFKYSEFSNEESLNLSVKKDNIVSDTCINLNKTGIYYVYLLTIKFIFLDDKQCGTSLSDLPTTPLFTLHDVFFCFFF